MSVVALLVDVAESLPLAVNGAGLAAIVVAVIGGADPVATVLCVGAAVLGAVALVFGARGVLRALAARGRLGGQIVDVGGWKTTPELAQGDLRQHLRDQHPERDGEV